MPKSPTSGASTRMIDQFWLAAGIALSVSVALFAGYWRLSSWARSAQRDYVDDLRSMEAKIYSSRLVPKILELFADLSTDQSASPVTDVSEILSKPKYAAEIRSIAEVQSEIDAVKNLYSDLKRSLFGLSRSLLYLGVVSLVAIPVMYLCPSGNVMFDQLFAVAVAYAAVVIVLRLVPQLSAQDRARRALSEKYDEIMVW
jgi:hypothetical protein